MSKSKRNLPTRILGQKGYPKFKEMVKLAGITGGAQLFIQALGLLSGILVIRLLSTEEYAFYTLANTMLGVMVVLADSGIGAGVMAEAGKVWNKPDELGEVLITGLDLRKKFAVGSLVISTPILVYLLNHHGASWLMSVLIVASIIPALIGSLTGSIFMVPLKLNQDIKPLQGNLIKESIGRVGLVLSLLILPWTFIAILAAGIPRLYMNLKLRKISSGYVDWSQKINLEVRGRVLKIVQRIMPGSIYYCVSGQISIWLISIFGSTEGVAEIGAIGRISMLLTLLNTIFATLIFPRFARLKEVKVVLLRRFIQIMTLITVVCVIVIGVVYLFSDQVLWILGDQYVDLNYALVLSVTGSSLGVMSGSVFKMSTHRGWAIHPGLSIPVSIIAIALGAFVMDVGTLEGVLKFNIFVVLFQLVLNLGYFLYKIFEAKSTAEPFHEDYV